VWGGAKEQEAEQDAGNWNAKNWQDEAQKVLEQMVHLLHPVLVVLIILWQMEHYWKTCVKVLSATPEPLPAASQNDSDSIASEYDRLRHTRLLSNSQGEGWEAELRRYIRDFV